MSHFPQIEEKVQGSLAIWSKLAGVSTTLDFKLHQESQYHMDSALKQSNFAEAITMCRGEKAPNKGN
jgi:hypothetical protein